MTRMTSIFCPTAFPENVTVQLSDTEFATTAISTPASANETPSNLDVASNRFRRTSTSAPLDIAAKSRFAAKYVPAYSETLDRSEVNLASGSSDGVKTLEIGSITPPRAAPPKLMFH